MKVNEVMTPNGDGTNDYLIVGNTDLTATNHIVITDQTSNIIFETDNYQNDWMGIDTRGNKVEAGVYYFVFTEKEGTTRQHYGSVTIMR